MEHVLGRVLREPLIAAEDFPAFDRSAMDGYALAADDVSPRFRVVGEVRPGEVPVLTLHAGECVRIFTGARLPAGASQVLIQEHAQRDGEFVVPTRRDSATHVRRRGEDARAGAVLLAANTRLGPSECALLAQGGLTAPLVSPAPRVVHLVTGDELVPPDQTPGPGQIRDTNSTLIAGLLVQSGARLVHQSRCSDDSVLAQAAALDSLGFDLLLISGGASVGDYDFGARALLSLGFEIHFSAVNLRPGKPLIFATRGAQAAMVIPGNPVSHFVVYQVAIALALECFEGLAPRWSLTSLPLAGALPGETSARETFWPARVCIAPVGLSVAPSGWRSSGDLGGLAGVNALLQVPAGSPPAAVGAPVSCLLLSPLTLIQWTE